MTAERWRQIEELFHAVATIPPAGRDTWLSDRCSGDPDLEREVRRLLAADAPDSQTIENLIGESVNLWLDRAPDGAPERLGPWRIVRPLGAGGMGAVYLAARDDDSYRQLAAIKILRPEQLAPGLRERFRQERQILAELEHPNIARLLDGGSTPDGRPYLVIEYVDGAPLTTYTADLSIPDRCRLFATVCDAVAFAHRNLIVHRDLKPANILVDRQGTPKLLDFGIAKLIGVDHGMTGSMHALFTPDYASPEQIQGHAITTATDVYALGAVLYEVLTGQPVRSGTNRSFASLVKEVTEGQVPPPSQVTAAKIPADLDRIVAKALENEPGRRYGTADQLAADLRRFLSGMPVEARGHSRLYALSKFARRHWVEVAAVALLVSGLAASTVWSLQQAKVAALARAQAESERDRAEHERLRAAEALEESDRHRTLAENNAAEAARQRATALERFHGARKLTHKFLFEIEDALKDTVGATKARQVLVATALEHFEQMGRQIDNDPALIRDLAFAYARIGDVQGNSGTANLGDYHGSVASYRKALDWHRKLRGNFDDRLAALETTIKLAKSLKWIGQLPEAEAAFERAARDLAPLRASAPPDKRALVAVYRSNLHRAWSEHMQVLDRHEKVRELLSVTVAELQAELARDPSSARLRRGIAADTVAYSRSLLALGDWPEAVRIAELSLSVTRELIGTNPPLREQARLIPPAIQLCEILHRAPAPHRNIPRAIAVDLEMVPIAEKLVSLDPANGRNQFMLANLLSGHGEHLRAARRGPDALAAYQRSVDIAEMLLKRSPANGYYQDMLGTDLILIGQLQSEMQDAATGTRNLRRGTEILEKSVAAGRLFNKPTIEIAKTSLARALPAK